MKNKRIIPLVLTLVIAPLQTHASASHNHAEHAHAEISGPNKGRIIQELEPHAELFVTTDRKIRLTFVDESGKPVPAPDGIQISLITGERSAPTTLSFQPENQTLISTSALPDGQNLPAILRVKTTPDARPISVRFALNLTQCGECNRPEYACACDH